MCRTERPGPAAPPGAVPARRPSCARRQQAERGGLSRARPACPSVTRRRAGLFITCRGKKSHNNSPRLTPGRAGSESPRPRALAPRPESPPSRRPRAGQRAARRAPAPSPPGGWRRGAARHLHPRPRRCRPGCRAVPLALRPGQTARAARRRGALLPMALPPALPPPPRRSLTPLPSAGHSPPPAERGTHITARRARQGSSAAGDPPRWAARPAARSTAATAGAAAPRSSGPGPVPTAPPRARLTCPTAANPLPALPAWLPARRATRLSWQQTAGPAGPAGGGGPARHSARCRSSAHPNGFLPRKYGGPAPWRSAAPHSPGSCGGWRSPQPAPAKGLPAPPSAARRLSRSARGGRTDALPLDARISTRASAHRRRALCTGIYGRPPRGDSKCELPEPRAVVPPPAQAAPPEELRKRRQGLVCVPARPADCPAWQRISLITGADKRWSQLAVVTQPT